MFGYSRELMKEMADGNEIVYTFLIMFFELTPLFIAFFACVFFLCGV